MHNSNFISIFLIFVAVSLLMDWYVFNGLRTFTTGWKSDRTRTLVHWGYLLISFSVTAVFLFGLSSLTTAKGMTPSMNGY